MEVVFDALESAAGSVSRIGSLLDEANLAAAFPTANIVPPGAEVVSAAITELFTTSTERYSASWPKAPRPSSGTSRAR